MEDNVIKFRLFLDKRENGIPQPNGTFSEQNSSDFFVNIPVYLTYSKFDDYINIDRDKSTSIIERGDFNPFFIELGFFSTIKATNLTGQTSINTYLPTETIYDKSKLYNITINK